MTSHLPMLGAREAGRLRTDDFHETPREAVEALLQAEHFGEHIWEPACGRGAISRVLEDYGHKVISTDLVDRNYGESRIDFLMERELRAPHIITNPPFKLAAQFCQHALDIGAHKVALLCRLGWLEGAARREMHEANLSRVWVFSRRLPMMHRAEYEGPKSTSAIAFAWFILERFRRHIPTIGWLP